MTISEIRPREAEEMKWLNTLLNQEATSCHRGISDREILVAILVAPSARQCDVLGKSDGPASACVRTSGHPLRNGSPKAGGNAGSGGLWATAP